MFDKPFATGKEILGDDLLKEIEEYSNKRIQKMVEKAFGIEDSESLKKLRKEFDELKNMEEAPTSPSIDDNLALTAPSFSR